MYFGESDPAFAFTDNSAAADNHEIKMSGKAKQLLWNAREVTDAVNPKGIYSRTSEYPEGAKRCGEVLKGKKVALIGGGGIVGREVIKNSVFLPEANLIVYDPGLSGNDSEGFQVAATLEEALQDAELVLLNLAGNQEILGAKELALLKRGAKVCNLARGSCVNPQALYEAIESNQISMAGLDVHVAEGKEIANFLEIPDSPADRLPGHWSVLLRKHQRVVATNHSAASEAEAEEINAEDAIRAVHRYNTRGEIENALTVYPMRFPVDGFVYERDGGGYAPLTFKDPRIVMEIFHDGSVPGLIARMRSELGSVVGTELQVVGNTLRNMPRGNRLNGVEMAVIDLPGVALPAEENERLLGELIRKGESLRGVRRARLFRVERK